MIKWCIDTFIRFANLTLIEMGCFLMPEHMGWGIVCIVLGLTMLDVFRYVDKNNNYKSIRDYLNNF